jgi:type II secretory pathway pseudopilin PulG
MKKTAGISLIELLISMLVASVLIIMVGSVSSIGTQSHRKYLNKAEIFNDVEFGLRMVRKNIREAWRISQETKGGSWIGDQIVLKNSDGSPDEVIGVLQVAGQQKFVYVPNIALFNISLLSTYETLFSVPITLSCSIGIVDSPPDLQNIRTFTITLSGTKNNIPFSLTATLHRRREA